MTYTVPELEDLGEESKVKMLNLIMSTAPITWVTWILKLARVPRRTVYSRAFNSPYTWNKETEDYEGRCVLGEQQKALRVEGARAMLATRDINFWMTKYLEETIQNNRMMSALARTFPKSRFTIQIQNEGLQTN